MADRDDLLIFGYTLEVNFKRKNDAKNMYRQFLMTNLFYDRYIKLTKRTDEAEKMINSNAVRLFEAVMKYDSYLKMVEELFQGYGESEFSSRICPLSSLSFFNNYEDIKRQYEIYLLKKEKQG